MTRRLGLSAVLVLCALAAVPAQADPISPLDPIIGVRGDDEGSPPVTDGSAFQLAPCVVGAGSYFCAPYRNIDVPLFAIDLSFWDENGLPIPTTMSTELLEGLLPNYFVAPESDFQLIRIIDQFTIRLCAAESKSGQEACGIFFEAEDPVIGPGNTLRAFSNTDGFVSVRAVNGVPNEDLPDNSAPIIPEPATLVLLGTGLAGVVGRRLRRVSRT